MNNKEEKSISQLEGWSWKGDIPVKGNSTYEEYNYYVLHNKPLKDYSLEDVYFMIGQEVGLKYFLPIAVDQLSRDPLLEACDYHGDLLGRLMQLEKKVWHEFPDLYRTVANLVKGNESLLSSPVLTHDLRKFLKSTIKPFLELNV